jgi:hypothetical protein
MNDRPALDLPLRYRSDDHVNGIGRRDRSHGVAQDRPRPRRGRTPGASALSTPRSSRAGAVTVVVASAIVEMTEAGMAL